MRNNAGNKIYKMIFAGVYPHYVAKAEKKGKKAEVDELIFWLTGYDAKSLQNQIDRKVDFDTFFNEAPSFNPLSSKIT